MFTRTIAMMTLTVFCFTQTSFAAPSAPQNLRNPQDEETRARADGKNPLVLALANAASSVTQPVIAAAQKVPAEVVMAGDSTTGLNKAQAALAELIKDVVVESKIDFYFSKQSEDLYIGGRYFEVKVFVYSPYFLAGREYIRFQIVVIGFAEQLEGTHIALVDHTNNAISARAILRQGPPSHGNKVSALFDKALPMYLEDGVGNVTDITRYRIQILPAPAQAAGDRASASGISNMALALLAQKVIEGTKKESQALEQLPDRATQKRFNGILVSERHADRVRKAAAAPVAGMVRNASAAGELITISEAAERIMNMRPLPDQVIIKRYSIVPQRHRPKTVYVHADWLIEQKRQFPIYNEHTCELLGKMTLSLGMHSSAKVVFRVHKNRRIVEVERVEGVQGNSAGRSVLAQTTGTVNIDVRALNAKINFHLRRAGLKYYEGKLGHPIILDCTTNSALKRLVGYALPTGAPFGVLVKTIRETEEIVKIHKIQDQDLPVVSVAECLESGVNIDTATEEQYKNAFVTAVTKLNGYLPKYNGSFAKFYTMQTDESIIGPIRNQGIDIKTLELTGKRETDTQLIVNWFNGMLDKAGILVQNYDNLQTGLRALAVAV